MTGGGRRARTRDRLREESGFTLVEVLVTIVMMTAVVFALYSMFDMSLRVFGVGNSTVEVSQNARVALDQMEREVRSAWPSDVSCGGVDLPEDYPLLEGSSNTIAFRNCLGPSDSPTLKTISYSVSGDSLVRTEGSGDSERLATLGSSGSLQLEYCTITSPDDCPDDPLPQTVLVGITLITSDTDGTGEDQRQTLVTNAGLRNANIPSGD